MTRNFVCAGLRSAALAMVLGHLATAQQSAPPDPHAGHQMPAADTAQDTAGMPAHDHSQMSNHGDMNQAGMYLMRMASGTSMNPQSWSMPMLTPRFGSWSMMIMGEDYLIDTQQSGPRGGDKLYSPNWFMAAGIHKLGRGSLLLQSMFSLDPATITHESYPLLFQTGETAYGRPLVDAQHPHDFVMSLGASYAHPLGEDTMLQLYYAPVGDPALGPVAFSHRASATELPQAPLGHHWQDSTHLANNVATLALNHKWLRLEASGFFGTEPDENRWNIDWGPMNSYSGRVSVFPSKRWMAQVSAGRISRPERQSDGDVVRTTASLHYTRPMAAGTAWSTSLIWGRNHDTASRHNLNSYLLESVYPITKVDFLTGRIEVVDKDELFANDPVLEHKLEHTVGSTFRVQAYTAGYTRDIATFHHVEAGVGANITAYAIPSAIQPFYGEHPWGGAVYLRFRLKNE